MTRARIAFVFDLRPQDLVRPTPPDLYAEFESMDHVQDLQALLESLGYSVRLLDAQADIVSELLRSRHTIDLVFNYSVGLAGRSREIRVPAVCEALGVPCAGSDPMAHAIGANKHVLKSLAQRAGLLTPIWEVIAAVEELAVPSVNRLIVKPLCEGSSMGVSPPIASADRPGLVREVRRVCQGYGGVALIEEFIEGYDVTVPLIGRPLRPLRPVRLTRDGLPLAPGEVYLSALKISPSEGWIAVQDDLVDVEELSATALAVSQLAGCTEFARVDFRVTPEGQSYLLELNTTPHLQPETGPFAIASLLEGRSFADAVQEIVQAALDRTGYSQNHRSPIS